MWYDCNIKLDNKGFKMLKDLIYTGLGAATILKERVEEEVQKLEDEGKIKQDDAKNLLERLQNIGKQRDSKVKTKLKEIIKESIDELGLATKEDIAKLKEGLK